MNLKVLDCSSTNPLIVLKIMMMLVLKISNLQEIIAILKALQTSLPTKSQNLLISQLKKLTQDQIKVSQLVMEEQLKRDSFNHQAINNQKVLYLVPHIRPSSTRITILIKDFNHVLISIHQHLNSINSNNLKNMLLLLLSKSLTASHKLAHLHISLKLKIS